MWSRFLGLIAKWQAARRTALDERVRRIARCGLAAMD